MSTAHVGQYFKARRALAVGIALSGIGVGNFLLPPLFRLLLDTYGLQGALLIMAAIALNVCVAGALLRPVSTYSKMKVSGQGLNSVETKRKNIIFTCLQVIKNTVKAYTLLEWSLLKKCSFILLGVTMFFYIMGFPAYYMSIPAYAEEVGHSKHEAAYLVSVSGLSELVGRISMGFLADYHFIPTYLLMAILAAVGAVCALLTPFITGLMPLAVISFGFTVTTASMSGLSPVIMAESLGAQRLPSAMGIVGIFMGLASLVGTPVSGSCSVC